MDLRLKEVIEAARAGDKIKARRLLVTLVRNHPRMPHAWFLLSFLVETRDQQIECLHRVISLSPHHPGARKQLEQLDNPLQDCTKQVPEMSYDNVHDEFQSSSSIIPTPLDDLVEQWFSVLSYREQKVLEYLFLDPNRFSLAAVGRIVSVSRQEIVEIRKRAILKLGKPDAYSIIAPFAILLFTILRKAGKSISEAQLDTALRCELVVGHVPPLGIVRLIFALKKEVGLSGIASRASGAKSAQISSASPKLTGTRISEKNERPYLTATSSATGHDSRESLLVETSEITSSHEKSTSFQDDETPIKALELSRRVYNALFRGNVQTVGQLASLSSEDILALRNIGETSLAEIEIKLDAYMTDGPHLIQNDKLDSSLAESPVAVQEHPKLVENDLPIAILGLSVRSYNALMRAGIATIRQLTSLSDTQLRNVKNVGAKTLREIKAKLEEFLAENPDAIQPHSAAEKTYLQSLQSFITLELLERVKTIPINEIPIDRLELSPIMNKGLNQQGIETIGQLLQYADRLEDDGKIGEQLNHYLTWLIEQDEPVWADEIVNKGISPLHQLVLADTSIEVMINKWLDKLTKRERNVINSRFGLYGQELTLREIGEQLGVSRERVRQIQKKALRKLESRYRHWRKKQLKPLIVYLHQVFIKHGGLLSQSEIVTAFENEDVVHLGNIDPIGTFLLLCETDAQFLYFKKQNFAGLSKYSADAITSVQASFVDILEKAIMPVPGDVLLEEFKKTEIYTSYKDRQMDYPNEFFVACLRVRPDIEQLETGTYTLEKRSKKRLGAIVAAMREIGEPAHYSVITEKTNERLPPDQHFTTRAIHARLGQYPDIFVWVRLRGTYGLKEWGLERDLSYVDACAHILENVGHPLTLEQVLAKLPEVRQFFDESSVLITLSTHERFYTFSNNRYGLIEWTTGQAKADFADLFGNQLARRQAELDRQSQNAEIDTQKELDTIRNIGLDFFSD